MKIDNVKIGLQIWALREDFEQAPLETLRKIKEMGYSGVELNLAKFNRSIDEYKEMLDETGLECYGLLTSLDSMTDEQMPSLVEACRKLGTNNVIIGSISLDKIKESTDALNETIEFLNSSHTKLLERGIRSGYHSHDGDFKYCVGDKSFYEYVLDNTPESFMMVLDTGNCVAGGGDPLALIKKYTKRTAILHAKGYSEENKYLTPVWEATCGLDEIIDAAIKIGCTEYFDVEFGARGDYCPTERAKKSADWIIKAVKSAMGKD